MESPGFCGWDWGLGGDNMNLGRQGWKVPVFVGGIWMFWSGSMAEGPQSLDFSWVHHGKIVGSHTYEPPSAIGRTGELRFLRFILSWNAQGFLDAIFQAFWKVEGRLFVATIPIRHFWTWKGHRLCLRPNTNSCNTKATKWDSQEISELVRVYDSNNYGLCYLQLYGVKLGGHIGAIQHLLFLSDDRLSSPLRGQHPKVALSHELLHGLYNPLEIPSKRNHQIGLSRKQSCWPLKEEFVSACRAGRGEEVGDRNLTRVGLKDVDMNWILSGKLT